MGVAEGPEQCNRVIKCMPHGIPDGRKGRNVNEQVLHNLGRIHGNGKEKAHKAMSELLEKILSKDNMNTAYKRVCAQQRGRRSR